MPNPSMPSQCCTPESIKGFQETMTLPNTQNKYERTLRELKQETEEA
jgi:hypothetical protein